MDWKKPFIKYFVNPILWKYVKGSNRFKYYKFMKKAQWHSLEHNRKIQQEKLYNLIKYVDEHIPYYQNIIKDKKITYSKDTIFEDIKKFPILTKKDIRENFHELQNKNITKFKKNTSGGSTGEPVIFLQDKKQLDYGAATKTLFDEWAGREEGELMIKIWGSERDIIEGTQGIRGFLVKYGMNIQLLNSFKMSNQNMKNYIEILNKKQPKLILAYVQSIYEIAKFAKENNIKVKKQNAIMTSAGTLYPKFKELIEEVFQCKVFDRYGSREVGDMACSCEKDCGLHLNLFNHYFEVLNEKNKPVKPLETGEIHVTTLNNKVMPLIRYQIGDRGVLTKKETCSCGRGLPLIKKIEGRSGSMIITEKGTIDSTALTTSFYYFNSIKKYKLIQTTKKKFLIKVVLNDRTLWQKEKAKLESKLKKLFGENVNIQFEIVEQIHNKKNGKYEYITSEVK